MSLRSHAHAGTFYGWHDAFMDATFESDTRIIAEEAHGPRSPGSKERVAHEEVLNKHVDRMGGCLQNGLADVWAAFRCEAFVSIKDKYPIPGCFLQAPVARSREMVMPRFVYDFCAE